MEIKDNLKKFLQVKGFYDNIVRITSNTYMDTFDTRDENITFYTFSHFDCMNNYYGLQNKKGEFIYIGDYDFSEVSNIEKEDIQELTEGITAKELGNFIKQIAIDNKIKCKII